MADLRRQLQAEMAEAEYRAWDSLARYKFVMYGYWCGVWVHLNRVGEFRHPNPWAGLVKQAKPSARIAKHKLGGGRR